jgi:hypothetical protein
MRCVEAYYDDANDRTADAAMAAADVRKEFIEFAVETMARNDTIENAGTSRERHFALNAAIELFSAPTLCVDRRTDVSRFYKYVVSSGLNAFADLRMCDFVFVYNRDDERKRTFGVSFPDFIDNAAEVGMAPYLYYAPAEACIVDAVLTDQQPVPNLTPAPARRELDPFYEARFERLTANKPWPAAGQIVGTALHQRHTFVTLRSQDMNANILHAIEAIANSEQVRGVAFAEYALHAAVDGTKQHNQIIDFYFAF